MQVQDLLFEGTELTVDPFLQMQQPLLIQQMLFGIGTRIRLQQIEQLGGFRVCFAALSARNGGIEGKGRIQGNILFPA